MNWTLINLGIDAAIMARELVGNKGAEKKANKALILDVVGVAKAGYNAYQAHRHILTSDEFTTVVSHVKKLSVHKPYMKKLLAAVKPNKAITVR